VQALLKLSRAIDALSEGVGKATIWLVLVVTLISAANAFVRYTFNYSSNGLLEIQWYLFSAIFLLCAGYTLMRNEHVRIDVISGRFSPRTHAWIDIIGTLFFLAPMAVAVLYLSWPIFINAYLNNEYSSNAGGLIVWPVRALVPIGFSLLILQGVSELIKRVAFLKGLIPIPTPSPKRLPPKRNWQGPSNSNVGRPCKWSSSLPTWHP
jgi:TRAP-type mannitol/chloroaromatic compound transport system permease small subunit